MVRFSPQSFPGSKDWTSKHYCPEKNSVIVMDNASIHKSEELQQMIEDRCVNMCKK